MSNITFLGSANKAEMTLSDLSNSLFGANIDIRMNSPNFNQAIKTDVPPLKLQSTPYLKSALPNRFYGPARVPRKGTSQASTRPNLNDSKEAIENKTKQNFKKPFQALGQKINPSLGTNEGTTQEVQIREIRKKNRNYQPLSARDKSTSSIERVQTEGSQPVENKSHPFEKLGISNDKWEPKSLSDYESNESIVRSYSAPSRDYIEITIHEKMMREIDELEPIKGILEKTFASIQTKNVESCKKYLTGVMNDKISEDCFDCNPVRLIDNYDSVNTNRSQSVRRSLRANTFEEESFGSPTHKNHDYANEIKPTFEGNKLKFTKVPKLETKNLNKPPLIQRGQNPIKLNLPSGNLIENRNLRSILGENQSNNENRDSLNFSSNKRRGSYQESHMEDSTVNYRSGGNGSNFFVRLTRLSSDRYTLKFTSIYNSFETTIKENESTEVSFPRSFLTDGSSSPLLPSQNKRSGAEDLKVNRVQSARVHLATEPNENSLKYSREGDRFLTQGNSPGYDDDDMSNDHTCTQCHQKLEGVKRAIDEFMKIDNKVSPLIKALNESVNKMLKDFSLAEKNSLIQNLTNLSQINKGFVDSAFLLSPFHAKGFETLWKCAILNMEYIFRIYDKRISEFSSSKNLLTGRNVYSGSTSTTNSSHGNSKIDPNAKIFNEYLTDTLNRRLSNDQPPMFLKKDNPAKHDMGTGNFGGFKKK